jgi:hypothetical protein
VAVEQLLVGTDQFHRLSNNRSVWYGADDQSKSAHHLALRCKDREDPCYKYYRGIHDGLFRPNADSVPIPDWRPSEEFIEMK